MPGLWRHDNRRLGLRAGARLPLVLVIAALALVAPACGGDDDERAGEPTQTDETEDRGATTAPTDTADATAECSNDPNGYSVEYPADWHTNSGEVSPECSYFDPEPFEVPPAQEFFDAAVAIRREPVPLSRIRGEDPATRVLERETLDIDGRRAVRREFESTGQALLPEGTRGYQYLIDVDGETLVAETFDLEGHDFRRNRNVLDAMAESLDIGD